MDSMPPGQLIVPHGPEKPDEPVTEAPQQPNPIPVISAAPQPTLQPMPDTTQQTAPIESVAQTATDSTAATGGWQFRTESTAPEQPVALTGISWTASEFIAHDKDFSWYAMLAGGAVTLAAVVYLITKDKISTGVVIFAAAVFGYFAAHKPETKSYSLSDHGLQIGQKFYGFQDFKTFSIDQDGAIANVVMTPLKRFMPPLTIYLAPDIADNVVAFLGNYLPFEQRKSDAVDGLLKRIRF